MSGFFKVATDKTMAYYTFAGNKCIQTSPSNFGYDRDIFNYYDELRWERITTLEDSLWGIEWELTTKVRDLTLSIQSQINTKNEIISINIKQEEKELIIDIILFMSYKILFYEVRKWQETKVQNGQEITQYVHDKINQIVSNCSLENCLKSESLSLYDLCKDPRKWLWIYSDQDLFYFWDQPFHFSTNRNNWTNDGNNFQTFFSRKWSNLYFPITKNLALVIENPPDNGYWWPINAWIEITSNLIQQVEQNIKKDRVLGFIPWESIIDTVLYRIVQNCEYYIAWPDEGQLKKALSNYGKATYLPDPVSYIYKEKLFELLDRAWVSILHEIS